MQTDDTEGLLEELTTSGDYWAFKLNDELWLQYLNLLVERHLIAKNITDAESALQIRYQGKTYFFLRKYEFPSLLMAEALDTPVPELEESPLIVLEEMEVQGDRNPPAPTVGYAGTA